MERKKRSQPVVLTQEQEEAIKALYPLRSNKEIAEKLGLSEIKISNFAKKHGLRKDTEYMRELQTERGQRTSEMARIMSQAKALVRDDVREELRAEVYEEVRMQVLDELAEKQQKGELGSNLIMSTTKNREYRNKLMAQAFRSFWRRGELTPKTYNLTDPETGKVETVTIYKVKPDDKSTTRQQAIELSDSIHI